MLSIFSQLSMDSRLRGNDGLAGHYPVIAAIYERLIVKINHKNLIN